MSRECRKLKMLKKYTLLTLSAVLEIRTSWIVVRLNNLGLVK